MSEVESWLGKYIPAGGRLALDIGANAGNWTVELAERFSETHAFEPNPQAFHMLRGRLAARANVRLCEFAVGDDVGDMVLRLYPNHAHASAYLDGELDTMPRGGVMGRIKVPLVSLDALGYEWRPVDFVKVDTEGSERDVMLGAYRTIAASRPNLLIEVHTEDNRYWIKSWLENCLGYDPWILNHPNPDVPAGHCWIVADRP